MLASAHPVLRVAPHVDPGAMGLATDAALLIFLLDYSHRLAGAVHDCPADITDGVRPLRHSFLPFAERPNPILLGVRPLSVAIQLKGFKKSRVPKPCRWILGLKPAALASISCPSGFTEVLSVNRLTVVQFVGFVKMPEE
jgi:hypothetical protein